MSLRLPAPDGWELDRLAGVLLPPTGPRARGLVGGVIFIWV